MNKLSEKIKFRAHELGFSVCGIAHAEVLPEEAKRLKQWLANEFHGEMHYMENHFEKRTDPRKLIDGARSVIVVLQNYKPEKTIPYDKNYKISAYAYGKDYHEVMKKKLWQIIDLIKSEHPDATARAFVDSAPVLERTWAARAGLGWIGKNTCLINKEKGSFFFLGEIITDIDLPADNSEVPNHCGGCTRCIQACPTNALGKEGLDARKCLSYLTIEYRGENLPVEFNGKFEDWIFGCDICQEVCPWNRLSEPHKEPLFEATPELLQMRKKQWHELTEENFKRLFKGSAVKRTKFAGLKRNIDFLSEQESEGEQNC